MRKATQALTVVIGLLCLGPARAGTPDPATFHVSVVRSAATATVNVQVALDAGWHIYSVAATPNGPAPTEISSLSVAGKPLTPLGVTTESAPIRRLDPNFGEVVAFHEAKAVFSREFQIGAGGLSGPVSATIHFETCNSRICIPPRDITFAAIRAPSNAASTRFELVQSAAPAPVAGSPVPPAAPLKENEGSDRDSGIIGFLLAAFGFGLLALLTPCVFPLIPITLANFAKMADGDRVKLTRLAAGYALGIVTLYVLVGLVVTVTLGAAGANAIAANPWVNLVSGVLFVVFAFSFFEAIRVPVPARLGNLQQNAMKHGGIAGLALLGITFVLGSFTCTMPFVGTLLVAAAAGARLRPLIGMTVFSAAFASPFFLCAAVPQWIGLFPKSGPWLARFKATLGFLELIAALKFLSNADLVWQWKIITQPVLLAAWAMLFLLASLYLLGLLRFGVIAEINDINEKLTWPRIGVAALFAAAAACCFWGLTGRQLPGRIAAYLPPADYGVGHTVTASGDLPWLTDFAAARSQALAEGKPLIVNFTGYTCTNCRYNEIQVLPQPSVQRALAPFVRVELFTDGTGDGANQKLQQNVFGDIALPLYGIIDPKTGSAVAKTEGVQTAAGFAAFLRNATSTADQSSAAPAVTSASLWAPYSRTAVASAAAAHKPAIIDFTANWCVNCKEIERDVFESPPVKADLGQNFVTLKCDMTDWSSAENTALQQQFGIAALPAIVFLDPSGREIKALRITGRVGIPDFQRRMRLASGS